MAKQDERMLVAIEAIAAELRIRNETAAKQTKSFEKQRNELKDRFGGFDLKERMKQVTEDSHKRIQESQVRTEKTLAETRQFRSELLTVLKEIRDAINR